MNLSSLQFLCIDELDKHSNGQSQVTNVGIRTKQMYQYFIVIALLPVLIHVYICVTSDEIKM